MIEIGPAEKIGLFRGTSIGPTFLGKRHGVIKSARPRFAKTFRRVVYVDRNDPKGLSHFPSRIASGCTSTLIRGSMLTFKVGF